MDKELKQLIDYIKTNYSQGTWNKFLRDKGTMIKESAPVIYRQFAEHGLHRSTRMFREHIEQTFNEYVLPKIYQKNEEKFGQHQTKILSLPCANGEEVFTLAILCLESGLKHYMVEGRDISKESIDKAIKGETWVSKERIKSLESFIEKKYFHTKSAKFPKTNFFVNKIIKKKCEFYVHDILKEPVNENYDVIFCLNLLMHLSEEGRNLALLNLTANMNEGDLLILDKKYEVPSKRLFSKEEINFGWKRNYNNYIEDLVAFNELRLQKIGEPAVFERY